MLGAICQEKGLYQLTSARELSNTDETKKRALKI